MRVNEILELCVCAGLLASNPCRKLSKIFATHKVINRAFSFNDGSSVITDTDATTGFTFNAANTNTIYKNISNVQPAANHVLIIIKT